MRRKNIIDLVENEDKVKSDDEIHSVIEQKNDKGKIQEKVSENLDILDIVNLDIAKVIEDKLGEVLVDNENVENKTGPEGDVRSEKIIKERIEDEKTKRDSDILEEQIGKMKYMTESEIEEYVEMLANSVQERKLLREAFKIRNREKEIRE